MPSSSCSVDFDATQEHKHSVKTKSWHSEDNKDSKYNKVRAQHNGTRWQLHLLPGSSKGIKVAQRRSTSAASQS